MMQASLLAGSRAALEAGVVIGPSQGGKNRDLFGPAEAMHRTRTAPSLNDLHQLNSLSNPALMTDDRHPVDGSIEGAETHNKLLGV